MNHTWWDVMLESWPLAIFVPVVLLGLTALVVIIRIVDAEPKVVDADG